MTRNFVYPELISELREACQMHAENQMQADDFQALIQRAEREIVAYEDKDIHSKMTEVEGQLELIKFTVDDGRQFEATRDVVISLSNWLKEL